MGSNILHRVCDGASYINDKGLKITVALKDRRIGGNRARFIADLTSRVLIRLAGKDLFVDEIQKRGFTEIKSGSSRSDPPI